MTIRDSVRYVLAAGTRTFTQGIACLAVALLTTSVVQAQHGRSIHHRDAGSVGSDSSFVGDLSYDTEPEYDAGAPYDSSAQYERGYDEYPAEYQDEYPQQGSYERQVGYQEQYAQQSDYAYDSQYDYQSDIDQVGFLCNSGSDCNGCGAEPACCRCIPWWAHRTGGFGQFLLLRPGNTDIIYAIEQDSVLPNDDPTGPIGRVNVDEEAGFRVGLNYALNDCSSLVSSFTRFTGDTSHAIEAAPGNVLYSPIIHPSEENVGDASGTAAAELGIDFRLVDVAYRNKWKACNTYAINWLAGFRYGNLEQDFTAAQTMPIAVGPSLVETDVNFNGFGMLLGIDGIKRSTHSGFSMYGKGTSSFLAGDWKGRYRQTNQIVGGGVIANEYEDFRVTPVVELELGFGWTSKCGKWHLNAGYMTSAWYDAVSSREYIDAVRAADYSDVQERITFSGLTAGIEGRF